MKLHPQSDAHSKKANSKIGIESSEFMLANLNTTQLLNGSNVHDATERQFLDFVLSLTTLPAKVGTDKRYTDYLALLNAITEMIEARLQVKDQTRVSELKRAFGYGPGTIERRN